MCDSLTLLLSLPTSMNSTTKKSMFGTILEDGADRLSRNVSNELPFCAALLIEKPLSCTLKLLYELLNESP